MGKTFFAQSITAALVAMVALSTLFFTGCRWASVPQLEKLGFPPRKSQSVEREPENQQPAAQVAHQVAPAHQVAQAQGPIANIFQNVIPRRTVEADPNNEYRLTEMEGPFLIFAATFSGPTARQDAHALALEFRRTHNWHAYVYEHHFSFNVRDDFRGARHQDHPGRTAVYRNRGGNPEFAVLIGNFPSLEDRQFERTLADVRKNTSSAIAFGVRNPMLPPEQQGVDAFIESININRPHSLLRNPRKYTVRIATFRGGSILERADNLDSVDPNRMAGLQVAEQTAAALTRALRERGVEAYEFHDRHVSIVTVGGFDQYQQQLPNGTTRHLAEVENIIRRYEGQRVRNNIEPVLINGIPCDIKPEVIPVPKVRR